MKKLLFTICLSMVCMAGFAQLPTFGIKGGLNFAELQQTESGSTFTSSALTTFNAGVFVDLKFGAISLQPALNFIGEGGSVQMSTFTHNPGGGSAIINYTDKTKLYYLQLPVNLVYHIPVIVGDIYFGAGPYIARGLSGKTTTTFQGDSQTQDLTFGNADGDVKAMQYGADVIVGFKFKGGLLINANYDLGLSNDAAGSENGTSKSRVIGVSIGYCFL